MPPKYLVLRAGALPDNTTTAADQACDENPPVEILSGATDYAKRITYHLDRAEFKSALNAYFGEAAYDGRMADWVVYLSKKSGSATVTQGLVGQDRRVIGRGKTRIVSELFGNRSVWVMVFSTIPPEEAPKGDAPPADAPAAPSPCPDGADGGFLRARLSSTEYQRGLGELAFDTVARALVNTAADKEPEKGSGSDPVDVCMVDISKDPPGRLFVGFRKLDLQMNTVNGLTLLPPEGSKTIPGTDIRSVHTTFGNGEQGRLGVSMAVGSPIRARARTSGNIEDLRPGPYILAHWYFAYPNRPWRDGSASVAIGASIRDGFEDHYFLGMSWGHILGHGGLVFGASLNKADRVYATETRTIWWARPFVGFNYAL